MSFRDSCFPICHFKGSDSVFCLKQRFMSLQLQFHPPLAQKFCVSTQLNLVQLLLALQNYLTNYYPNQRKKIQDRSFNCRVFLVFSMKRDFYMF